MITTADTGGSGRLVRERGQQPVCSPNSAHARTVRDGEQLLCARHCEHAGQRHHRHRSTAANADVRWQSQQPVEREFFKWSMAIGLPEKLRILRMARSGGRRRFGLFTNNPVLATPVKLDVRLIEADQVASPWTAAVFEPRRGGRDRLRRPRQPESVSRAQAPSRRLLGLGVAAGYDQVPASSMLHYYRANRPGQSRGIPELTPALPLLQ